MTPRTYLRENHAIFENALSCRTEMWSLEGKKMTDTNRMTMILEKDICEKIFMKRLDVYKKNLNVERERENVERRILSARALKSPSHLSFPCLKYFPRGFCIYIQYIYIYGEHPGSQLYIVNILLLHYICIYISSLIYTYTARHLF